MEEEGWSQGTQDRCDLQVKVHWKSLLQRDIRPQEDGDPGTIFLVQTCSVLYKKRWDHIYLQCGKRVTFATWFLCTALNPLSTSKYWGNNWLCPLAHIHHR